MRASLEIWDVASASFEVVLQSPRHIEAPNFMPDGQSLIVNCDGGLYRVPLDAPELICLNSFTHTIINNDHAPSPDGRQIAFCDKSETGKSCIYLMPATGGRPRRVTAGLPSWFHAWMPDGQAMVYACVRDGDFAIARADLEGTEEVLISGPHHYDGPDVTPDGQWIWFNSDRSGAMALWRMRPDGLDPEQMTDGSTDDWFPHPSPDGAHLCYLAYDKDTEGHPFGVDVDLCLMPQGGGAAEVLQRIHGGQGCLNSPCWAPDGARFAYIRYFEMTEEEG